MSQAALLGASAAPTPPPAAQSGLRAVQATDAEPARAGDAPRLEIPGYDLGAALRLERELGVSHVLAQILVRRGLADPRAAQAFLIPSEAHDPSAFEGIEQAVDTIRSHLSAGHRITVHGDYDVDGVCATAVMVRALRALGANVGWFLPARLEDGYGLSLATVNRLAAGDTRLLITVDCGITAVAEVATARAAGIDVVLSDHHAPRPDGQLPDCRLVHPTLCGYPCPDLCGTAVAYKLAQALGAASAEEDLELVALATVADLVPLRGENRRLVRDGLRRMSNTCRPGLRALMQVSRVDPSALDAGSLGFRLAPRINAAGRLRRADAGLELLLTDDAERAAEIATELDAVNTERRAVQQRIGWEVEAQIVSLGPRSAYVLAGEGWHPGVIGIVASQVTEHHHRPAVVLALDGERPAQGSGRSIPGFDLLAALHTASDHMIRYGGHRAAAGMTVQRERIPALRAAIEDYAEANLTEESLNPAERVDAVACGSELGLALAEELTALEPCGLGNARSRLLVPGARFADVRAMGEGHHARFSVHSGGVRAQAVAFGCEGRLPGGGGEPLDATFRLERNVWNGAVTPRLVLSQARPSGGSPIELLGELGDYLAAVLDELTPAPAPGAERRAGSTARTVIDRRGHSPLAVLTDATAAGGPVLAVCADVSRRLPGLAERAGGFALVSAHALERRPELADDFPQLVVLDPPAAATVQAVLGAGPGYTHLAWGQAELRFAEQMHELEYGLRTPLVALYRDLRSRQRVAGEELERLLRGDGPPGRPARLAARLIRVLAELELVSLDRNLPALAIAGAAPTALERSPAYRVYAQRHEDGRRFLTSANRRPSA